MLKLSSYHENNSCILESRDLFRSNWFIALFAFLLIYYYNLPNSLNHDKPYNVNIVAITADLFFIIIMNYLSEKAGKEKCRRLWFVFCYT